MATSPLPALRRQCEAISLGLQTQTQTQTAFISTRSDSAARLSAQGGETGGKKDREKEDGRKTKRGGGQIRKLVVIESDGEEERQIQSSGRVPPS